MATTNKSIKSSLAQLRLPFLFVVEEFVVCGICLCVVFFFSQLVAFVVVYIKLFDHLFFRIIHNSLR